MILSMSSIANIFGNNDFTIEFYINPVLDSNRYVLSSGYFITNQWYIYLLSNGTLQFYLYDYSSSSPLLTTATSSYFLTANTTYHIALVRKGATYIMYINGVNITQYISQILYSVSNSNSIISIGYLTPTGFSYFNGKIDELRITNGIARYITNFTIPFTGSGFPSIGAPYNINLLSQAQSLTSETAVSAASSATSNISVDPYYNKVTSLIHFNDASFADTSVYSLPNSNISTTYNTLQSVKIGTITTGGGYFNGSNQLVYSSQFTSFYSASLLSLTVNPTYNGAIVSWIYNLYPQTTPASLVISSSISGTPVILTSSITTLGPSGSSYTFSSGLSQLTSYYAYLSESSSIYGSSNIATQFTTLTQGTLSSVTTSSPTSSGVTVTWTYSGGYTSNTQASLIISPNSSGTPITATASPFSTLGPNGSSYTFSSVLSPSTNYYAVLTVPSSSSNGAATLSSSPYFTTLVQGTLLTLVATNPTITGGVTITWTYGGTYNSSTTASLILSSNSNGSPILFTSTINTLGVSSSSYTFLSGLAGLTTYYAILSVSSVLYGNSSISTSFTTPATGLYNYTVFTFTTLGLTGATGPTNANLTLSSGYNSIYPGVGTSYGLTITSGFQYWTVPLTGYYSIVAAGASGGKAFNFGTQGSGTGIIVYTSSYLKYGTLISILVGQYGIGVGSGGGSFIFNKTSNSLILIAGGGSSDTTFSTGNQGLPSNTTSGGPNGGVYILNTYAGGPGGSGYTGAGQTNGAAAIVGQIYAGGATGGIDGGNQGGFGCGSADQGSGGGGYGGGSGLNSNNNGGALGAGSYDVNGTSNNATIYKGGYGNTYNVIGGSGFVIISLTNLNYYTFTTFTFTNIGATGSSGPTSLANYSGTYPGVNTSYALTLSGGIQYWTVPKTGNYNIIAAGAASSFGSTGRGIIVSTIVNLIIGQQVLILIGQQGALSGSNQGGGGGTFVATTFTNLLSATPILVAGGGGGGWNGTTGTDAVLTTAGTAGTAGGTGGTLGNAGTTSDSRKDDIGCGFYNNTVITGNPSGFIYGGLSSSTYFGGFGGAGNGGGGYSGGGGVTSGSNGNAGSGGSYDINGSGNAAIQYTLSVNSQTGGYNTGNGFVVITSLGSLDGLSATPTVLFSTKRVKTSYVGAIIQLSTSSTLTSPQDFYYVNGALNTNSSGTGTSFINWVGISTAYVSIWYDQSGNGKNAIGVSGYAAIYIDALGLVDFTGNVYMTLPVATLPSTQVASSFCWKNGNMSGSGVERGLFCAGNATTNQMLGIGISTTNYAFVTSYATYVTSNINLNSGGIVSIIATSTTGSTQSYTLYTNSVYTTTGNISSLSFTASGVNDILGSDRNNTAGNGAPIGHNFNGQVYWISVFASAISTADRILVEGQ